MLKSVGRWCLVLPAAVGGSLVSVLPAAWYALLAHAGWGGGNQAAIAGWFAPIVGSAFFVFGGSWAAPVHKRGVAFGLAGLQVAISALYLIVPSHLSSLQLAGCAVSSIVAACLTSHE